MPALIKYERKALTLSQLNTLRDYIKRKRLNEESLNANGVEEAPENDKQEAECPLELEPKAQAIVVTPCPPPAPSAQELREGKQRSLNDVSKQLEELERVLDGLKQKKHELFEEFKSLLSSKKSENESKKQGGERPMLGFPPPFMGQLTGQGTLTNVSPYRPGFCGIKRPKSPSPPLVQLYSPSCSSSSLQSSFDMSHHPTAAAAGTFPGQGDMPRPPFQQMGTKMSCPGDNMLPNYQLQQNFPPLDPRQQAHGSQDNPRPSPSSQAPGNQYGSQERQFVETRHLQDRNLPSNFGSPQSSSLGMTGHGIGSHVRPRQSLMNHPSFLQQNMLPGQQQAAANMSDGGFPPGVGSFAKERPGFNNPCSHRPQGYIKRGSHTPGSRSSRYY